MLARWPEKHKENRNDQNATLPRRLHRHLCAHNARQASVHSYRICSDSQIQTATSQAVFYGLCRLGWAIVPAVLALSVLTGCDDLDSYAADQASLADAIAMAAKEAGK